MVKAMAPLPLIFLPISIGGSAVKRRFKSLTSDSQLPSSMTLKNENISFKFSHRNQESDIGS